MMLLIYVFIIYGNLLQVETNEGNSTKTTKMTMKAGDVKQMLIKQCPIIASEDLPYDYQQEYQQKLVIDIEFNLLRLLKVGDLEKT